MITITGHQPGYGNYLLELSGKSTDEKPVGKFQGETIRNGSRFYELDTSAEYRYDEEEAKWRRWNGSSGSGEGSISTATATTPGTVMVKTGSGLVVGEDGDLSLDAATMEDLETLTVENDGGE